MKSMGMVLKTIFYGETLDTDLKNATFIEPKLIIIQ